MLIPLAGWSEQYLDDSVDIPKDKNEMLVKHPEKFMQVVLQDLGEVEEWFCFSWVKENMAWALCENC